VERWEVLGCVAAFGVPWYQFLQHGSTAVGGIVLVLWSRRLGPLSWTRWMLRRWAVVLGVSAAGAIVNAERATGPGAAAAFGAAAVGGMAAFAASLLLVAGVARTRPAAA
jgi:hypothetical protein